MADIAENEDLRTLRITNHHIIAKHTYDEDMLPLLAAREATQDSIIRSFRRRMDLVHS